MEAAKISSRRVRVAALYDIHGNLPALEAVLAKVPADAAIVVGGDFVCGPLRDPTVARLRELGERAILVRGNCERDDAEFAGLPLTVSLDVDGLGPTLFFHATPRSDEEIFTLVTPDEVVAEMLADAEERVLVCGHTHVQCDRAVGGKRVVNAGSIGMPYEGVRGAFWALLGPDVELRRTEYDVESAVADFRESDWTDARNHAEVLLEPPDPHEVSVYFEQRAGRG